MNSIRVASLFFVVASVCAPLPVAAQGGSANNLQAQVTALQTALATETAARVAAVAALQTALANEASARAAADSTLQTNINGEASSRAAADSTVQTNINSEASSRAAADAALDARVAKFEGNITAADLEGSYNLYMLATAIDGTPTTITSYVVNGTMTFGAGGTGQTEGTVAAGRQLSEQVPNLNWLLQSVGGSGVFDGSFSWVYNNGVVTINAGGDINDFTPTAGGQVMLGVQGGPPGNNQIIFVLTRQPSN